MPRGRERSFVERGGHGRKQVEWFESPRSVQVRWDGCCGVQSGDVNMALYKTWAERSGEFMDWLGDLEEPMGMTFPFEYHAPDPTIAPEAYYPPLRVNARGERFMNEDSTYPEIFAQGQHQPGGYSWQVFDSTYWDDIVRFDTGGCSRLAPVPDGSAFNADVYDLEALTKEHLDSFWFEPVLDDGTMKKCDTIEELADAMAFGDEEKKTFLVSVKRYRA